MHRTARTAMVATVLAVLSAPTLAQELVDGGNIDTILEIAKAHGEAVLETQTDGDPRISGRINGLGYQLFFMNCTASKDCEDLNFYAGFAELKPTVDAINDWNRNKRFGNAYLDSDLDAVIEFDVNLEFGVSRDNLDAAFGLWELLLQQYAEHIGYRTGT
jgi:hypothetical protein